MLDRSIFIVQLRWKRLAFGLMWILVVGGMTFIGLRTECFHCERSSGEKPTCTFDVSAPLSRSEIFPPGSIGAVEMFERKGNAKERTYFTVTVLDRRGAETHIVRYYDKDSAIKERDRLRAYLADPNATTFIRENGPDAMSYLWLVAAVAIGIGICLWGIFPGVFPAGDKRATSSFKHIPQKSDWKKSARVIAVMVVLVLVYCGVMLFITESDVGWVQIRAESRCRFGDTVLLPGGYMQIPLSPGHYNIDIFNPDVPGNWVPKTFEVKSGRTIDFTCDVRQSR
jgi:hypothetical protein